jgi:NADH:ubiquinone oxidoreductase subunit 6 (subunit J)
MNLDFQIIIKILLFSFSVLFSIIVVSANSPIYAVLALIILFIVSSVIFLLHGVELLALIYLLVYVGALLILFLWVVMTMPVKKNSFLHLRLTVVCLLVFTSFVSIVLINDLTTIKIIRISPDSHLFSVFVRYLNENIVFQFSLRFSSNSKAFISLSHVIPPILVKQIHAVNLDQSNFLYNIYALYASQKFFLLAPISPNSAIFMDFLSIYRDRFRGDTVAEAVFLPQVFLHFVGGLNSSSEFISLSWLLEPNTKNFLLLATNKVLQKNVALILPPFVNTFDYIFIKPAFFKTIFFSLASITSNSPLPFFSTKVFIAPFVSAHVTVAAALYHQFAACLLFAGFILLIAIVGAVTLVKFQKLETKSQQIYLQTKRDLDL